MLSSASPYKREQRGRAGVVHRPPVVTASSGGPGDGPRAHTIAAGVVVYATPDERAPKGTARPGVLHLASRVADLPVAVGGHQMSVSEPRRNQPRGAFGSRWEQLARRRALEAGDADLTIARQHEGTPLSVVAEGAALEEQQRAASIESVSFHTPSPVVAVVVAAGGVQRAQPRLELWRFGGLLAASWLREEPREQGEGEGEAWHGGGTQGLRCRIPFGVFRWSRGGGY